MKKRTLSVLLTAAMAVSMLAGCGSKTEAPAETAPAATQEAGGGNALAVSSGDEIATILDLLVPEQYQGERIANCSVTVLTYKDGLYELKACGDVSYMQAGEESNK